MTYTGWVAISPMVLCAISSTSQALRPKADTHAVYVSRKLKRVLQQYYPSLQHRLATGPLFQTQIRTRFSADTMYQLFLQIYKDCGRKGASSHSARRKFITKLANTGINVSLLAALAGHQQISTTQRYIDVNDAQLAQAVELI